MKKTLLLFGLISFLITTLIADSPDTTNGTIIENSKLNGHTLLKRKHNQTLTIDYSAQEINMMIYNSPFDKTIINMLKKEDIIQISEIWIIDSTETWLHITHKQQNGFILLEQSKDKPIYDYYNNGLWQLVDVIKIGNTTWHTLKCNQGFSVYMDITIRDKPGINGLILGIINATQYKGVNVKVIEVTKEEVLIDGKKDRWAKIQYGNMIGWVFAGYLEYDRGGPRFLTPESLIEMRLGQGI